MPAEADFEQANRLLDLLRSSAALSPDELIDILALAEDTSSRLRAEAHVLTFRSRARPLLEIALEIFGWAIGIIGFLAALIDVFVINGELGMYGLIDLTSAWLGLLLGAYMRQRSEWELTECRHDLLDVDTLLDAYEEIVERVNSRLSS